jgi:predicted metal-dependent hydrolase
VSLDHKRITLSVRPSSDTAKRAQVIHEGHKSLLHQVVPSLIDKWEQRLQVNIAGYFLQRMKTKWGSCNHEARSSGWNDRMERRIAWLWSRVPRVDIGISARQGDPK